MNGRQLAILSAHQRPPGQLLPPEGSDSGHIRGWCVLGWGPHPGGYGQQRRPAVDTPLCRGGEEVATPRGLALTLVGTTRVERCCPDRQA